MGNYSPNRVLTLEVLTFRVLKKVLYRLMLGCMAPHDAPDAIPRAVVPSNIVNYMFRLRGSRAHLLVFAGGNRALCLSLVHFSIAFKTWHVHSFLRLGRCMASRGRSERIFKLRCWTSRSHLGAARIDVAILVAVDAFGRLG